MQEVNDDNFQEAVLSHDSLVLVDFFANWCGPCLQLKPVLEELEAHFDTTVKFVQIDVDTSSHYPSQFGVRALPTLMLFKGGENIDLRVGSMNKRQLKEWLEQHISQGKHEMEYE